VNKKIERLRAEGVSVKNGKIVNFREIFFDDFRTEHPLKTLREEQEKLRKKVRIEDDFSAELVGGVDVSYSGRYAYAALVIMHSPAKVERVVYKKVSVNFPYIPTYLAFREEPVISSLLSEIDEELILMVDGNGILHPRFFGLASHIGVVNNIATVGVAKSLLLGDVVGDKIVVNNRPVGYFVKSGRTRGIYVSPGHRVSPETSLEIVKRYLKYKNPEPVRLAHVHANEFRKREEQSKEVTDRSI